MGNKNVPSGSDFNTELKLKGFKVAGISGNNNLVLAYNRKDFYKVCLNTGRCIIHYADKSFETEGPILFFANPHIPYSSQIVSPTYSGFSCLFTEDFFIMGSRSESLQQSPLFKLGGTPIINLNGEQEQFITTIFQKMIAEQDTDYA